MHKKDSDDDAFSLQRSARRGADDDGPFELHMRTAWSRALDEDRGRRQNAVSDGIFRTQTRGKYHNDAAHAAGLFRWKRHCHALNYNSVDWLAVPRCRSTTAQEATALCVWAKAPFQK